MTAWQSIYTAPLDERILVWCSVGGAISAVVGVVHLDGSVGWSLADILDTEQRVYTAYEPRLWRPCPKSRVQKQDAVF